MASLRLSLAAALTCQTILAGPALAQSFLELDPILLEGRAPDPAGPATSPNAQTLTGSKMSVAVTEIPQSVSVVSRAELEGTNATKLDSALTYRAGVLGQPYGYDSDTNWIFIRGFNATATGAFQDGLPNFSYGFGGFYVDPVLVERLDVLKGASSALYGGSNPGGLVNTVSRTAQPGNFGQLELGADETGGVWGTVDVNRQISDVTSVRGIAKLERVDGHGAFDDGYRGVVSGMVRHETGAGGTLTFGLDYTGIDETHVGDAWLPYVGTVVDAPFGRIPREFNTGEPHHDSYTRNQLAARANYAQEFDGWRLENAFRLGWSDVAEKSVYAYGYENSPLERFQLTPTASNPKGALSRLVFDHETETFSLMNDLRAETFLDLGPTSHRLTAGVDGKYFHMDQIQAGNPFDKPATPLTVVDPFYGAAQPAAVPYIDQKLDQTQIGFYLQDQMRWGDGWIVTANGRYDWVDTSTGVNKATGEAGLDRKDGEFSWRLGLAKELPGGFTPYVSASSYFNPQIVNSLSGNEVQPESGTQLEAGVKWAPDNDLLVTASVFQIDRENVSQTQWANGANVYRQIGEVRSRGVEVEAQGALTPNLQASAALTLLDLEIKEDVNPLLLGKTPYTAPEKTAAARLSWTPEAAPDWTLTGGVRWVGSSWADNENTLKVPSHTLVDLGVNWRFAEDWAANLAVSNLMDKEYVSGCQTGAWCYYGEGRKASLTLRKSF